ncbi:SPINDLE AND KINETOCHORE-ASSOCIATED PROTEIN 2 [Salix viminalis]|uniref:Protein FAM33A n=1 Tax=Salix viminalis TaxID=40686 RepID=A0A9Q0NQ94_SALVM|nr:SPINDLE AND KINETOCHORE-ASSOCIATED PROTEIN 2 [Salix viminalis]
MGHRHVHHQATDSLVNLFTKANNDLTLVQLKLEREFQQIYPDNANPVKLVHRIKKVQGDLTVLKDQCQELLAAKQDLIDKARTVLVGNRNLIQRMEVSMGVGVTGDAEDPAFVNFNQIIDEWTTQVRARTGDEKQDSDAEDINKLLFSAIVQNN